mgnify:CR=1 FL=1
MRRTVLATLVVASLGCGGLTGLLYMPPELPTAPLVLSGGTLWTGDGWSEGTVVLDGERIACVGNCDVPEGAQVLDVSGKEVVPGFVDLHVHLGVPTRDGAMGFVDLMTGRPSMRQGFLEHGVTTVRPLCDDLGYAQIMAMRVENAEWAGPRVEAVGPCFTAPDGHPARGLPDHLRAGGVRTPTDEEAARAEVRALREAGFPGVKVVYDDGGSLGFERMDHDVMAAVVDEARQGGQWVAAHIGSNEELLAVVAAGASTVEHAPREVLSDEAVASMKEAGVPFVPTLAVIEAVGGEAWLAAGKESVAKARGAGVTLGVGSDTQGPDMAFGEGLVRELELMGEAGVPRDELLRSVTLGAAEVLGRDDLGRLAPEAAADVVVLVPGSWEARTVVSRGRIVVGP